MEDEERRRLQYARLRCVVRRCVEEVREMRCGAEVAESQGPGGRCGEVRGAE